MAELSRTSADHLKRHIQSFVRREGRLTPAQKRALLTLWHVYGLGTEEEFDADQAFPRKAPIILEIGFGDGRNLAEMALSHPEFNFLGIEVHRPGIGHLLQALDKNRLSNVRVFCLDAVEVLKKLIRDHSLQRINIFFPDPWPKKRHHKRRLIQPDFVTLMAKKLLPGGILHLATDWPEYAQAMQDAIATCPQLHPIQASIVFPPRCITKYEIRGQRLGHVVTDLTYINHVDSCL